MLRGEFRHAPQCIELKVQHSTLIPSPHVMPPRIQSYPPTVPPRPGRRPPPVAPVSARRHWPCRPFSPACRLVCECGCPGFSSCSISPSGKQYPSRGKPQFQTEPAEALLSLQGLDDLGRPILLDCLLRLRDDAGVISKFDPPQGSAEEIAVMDALWAEGRRERLWRLLESPAIADSSDPSVTEVRTRYQMRLMI